MESLAYIRVSTEAQSREGISLDAQEEKIRAYAAMRGLKLVRIFREEGVSAAIPLAKRPQGRLLVEMLEKRQRPRHVIAVKLDRLFRSAADALVQAGKWDKAKRSLHVLDRGGSAVDTRSAIGRMFFTMTAAFPEMERNLTGERTRDGLAQLRREGRMYCRIAPLGFNRKKDRLVPNPKEMRAVRKIRRLRHNGLSMAAIADRLNAAGEATKCGGRWYAVTIQKILANRIYDQSSR